MTSRFLRVFFLRNHDSVRLKRRCYLPNESLLLNTHDIRNMIFFELLSMNYYLWMRRCTLSQIFLYSHHLLLFPKTLTLFYDNSRVVWSLLKLLARVVVLRKAFLLFVCRGIKRLPFYIFINSTLMIWFLNNA